MIEGSDVAGPLGGPSQDIKTDAVHAGQTGRPLQGRHLGEKALIGESVVPKLPAPAQTPYGLVNQPVETRKIVSN